MWASVDGSMSDLRDELGINTGEFAALVKAEVSNG
jgi:hypothetical protein